jgi:hypothetical protein
MASETDAPPAWVILASFENRRAAEHLFVSLRRGFRKKARKGHAMALVITGNDDGSLKLTQSRVVAVGGFGYTLVRVSLAVMIGFTGILSTLKGAKHGVQEAEARGSHVGSDEKAAHTILARVGPNAALALVCCDDEELRQAVVARAADRASESWDGSRAQFLADLDRGSQHDWLRAAIDQSA